MTTPGSKLISYIRVSDMGDRDEDSESTQTIRQQREANEAIAKLAGATIIDEVQALNASGGKAWPEPQLAEAIARVDAGEADGIVVYALDRWGRHLTALEVIERWADEGRTFLSASDRFDATTPSGRMSLRMMMVVARFYWEATRDRFMASQRDALKRGAHIARTPFGYARVTDEQDPRVGCLNPHPTTAGIVKAVFEIAAAEGMHAAQAYLEAHAPERRWETTDVRRLLSNRVYLGEVRLRDVVVRDAHEPLTSERLWLAAQTAPRARRRSGDYVLSGVATCGVCGAGLTGQLQTVRDRSYRRYRCSNPACRGGSSISADRLEAHVRDTLKEALADEAFVVRYDVSGVDEAREALERAEGERVRFAMDLELLRALGPDGARANAVALATAADAARARYGAVAGQATRVERLPAAEQLDDDAQLLVAIGAIVDTIAIARGRGSIDERVALSFRDLDDAAGTLAA